MEWERAGVSIKQKINKEISINYYSLCANLLWFYYIFCSGKFLSVIKLKWLSPPQALWNPTPYLVQNQRSSIEDDDSWSHQGVGLPVTCMRTAGL